MNVSRVGGGAKLRGTLTPFRLRPTHLEGAPVVHPVQGGGAGGSVSSAWQDFVVPIPPPRQMLVRGYGGITAGVAGFSGRMEVGPDPSIAIRHREDAELLLLL